MTRNKIYPGVAVSNNTLHEWAADLTRALKYSDPILRICIEQFVKTLEDRADDREVAANG